MEKSKTTINETVQKEKELLNQLSQNLWKKPELGFEERYAHKLLSDTLERAGFSVQRAYHLPTAFRAEAPSAQGDVGGVTVCIICEYDALPDIGHACGHNLIAEAGIAAALAVKATLESANFPGKLVVLGTPAEEGGGGKAILIRAGAFKDIDFAMMVHPAPLDMMYPTLLAVIRVEVKYFGREAHAAIAPWEGLNALDAAVACYNNISMLRQQMKPEWRIHGIITKGGTRPNIIPAETAMQFYIRATTQAEVELLKLAAIRCFEAAANATGCEVQYKFEKNSYDSFIFLKPYQDVYKKHAEELGVKFDDCGQKKFTGSTDMGNVSQVVPSIHPIYSIKTTAANHTRAFAEAAGTADAQLPTLIAAQSMALTAVELYTNKALQELIKQSFTAAKKVNESV